MIVRAIFALALVCCGPALADQRPGTPGNDVIRAHPLGSVIDAGEGNDKLIGNRGRDVLFGGPGIDLVHGGDGNDLLVGDAQRCGEAFFCLGEPARDIFRFFAGDGVDLIYDLDELDLIPFARPKQQVMFGYYGTECIINCASASDQGHSQFVLQMERTVIKVRQGARMPYLYSTLRGIRYLSLPVFETDDGYRDRFLNLAANPFIEQFGDADRIIRVTARDIGQTLLYQQGDDIDFGPMTVGIFRILVRRENNAAAVYRVTRRGNVIRLIDRDPVRFTGDILLSEFHWHNARVHTEALLDLASMQRGGDAPIGCLIKGNINREGERIYHIRGQHRFYDVTIIDTDRGERWFCTAAEAEAAGWRAAKV